MIITKTPLRIPLGGGGTDLPEYYSRFGGHLLTTAIDQHIFIFVQPWFENGIKVGYTKTEIVSSVDEIHHPVAREALRMTDVRSNIEILSMAELPSNTGLGSSAVYTVGLLKALHAYKGEEIGPRELAELACHLQIDILREPGGKQDQYAAAFGGVLSMDIARDGTVKTERLPISEEVLEELENNILYFYTGFRRSSLELQGRHAAAFLRQDQEPTEAMHEIKRIGFETEMALVSGDVDTFGRLLDAHWQAKRRLSAGISNEVIDGLYAAAKEAGALGGKLMGAGGGGFLMLYCPNGKKHSVRRAMRERGLREVKFRFEWEGSTVLLNLRGSGFATASPRFFSTVMG